MATSFIKYKNANGFWIDDSLFEVFLFFFYEYIINEENDVVIWIKESKLLELIKENSLGYYGSYMHLNLDYYLDNSKKEEGFKLLLRNSKTQLALEGKLISVKKLNFIESFKPQKVRITWLKPLEVERLLKIYKWMEDLIEGKINITAKDKVDYYF
ncbi:MAG: hypothetical protein R2730_05425 [Chitinophagales bacterium]